MSFNEAVATQPDLVRLWVLWMTVAMLVVPALLLAWRETRRDGWIVLASSLAVIVLMQVVFFSFGFTRILGLAHLVIWGPLAIWLVRRLRAGVSAAVPRTAMAVFLVTISVSLVFDAVDVVRYVAGDRSSLVAEASG